MTYVQIIQLMFIVAPDRIVQVISFAEDTQSLVGVVPIQRFPIVSLGERKTPVLDIDMLVALGLCFQEASLCQRYSGAVEVGSRFGSDQRKDGRGKVSVRSHDVGHLSTRDLGSADDKWNVNVLFEAALLARLKSMLANVIAVIAGINDVCIVEDAVSLKTRDNSVYEFVQSLERSKACTVEMVVEINVCGVLSFKAAYPTNTTWLKGDVVISTSQPCHCGQGDGEIPLLD